MPLHRLCLHLRMHFIYVLVYVYMQIFQGCISSSVLFKYFSATLPVLYLSTNGRGMQQSISAESKLGSFNTHLEWTGSIGNRDVHFLQYLVSSSSGSNAVKVMKFRVARGTIYIDYVKLGAYMLAEGCLN